MVQNGSERFRTNTKMAWDFFNFFIVLIVFYQRKKINHEILLNLISHSPLGQNLKITKLERGLAKGILEREHGSIIPSHHCRPKAKWQSSMAFWCGSGWDSPVKLHPASQPRLLLTILDTPSWKHRLTERRKVAGAWPGVYLRSVPVLVASLSWRGFGIVPRVLDIVPRIWNIGPGILNIVPRSLDIVPLYSLVRDFFWESRSAMGLKHRKSAGKRSTLRGRLTWKD